MFQTSETREILWLCRYSESVDSYDNSVGFIRALCTCMMQIDNCMDTTSCHNQVLQYTPAKVHNTDHRTDTGTCMEQCQEESSTCVPYMHTVLRLFSRGVTMHDKGGFVCPPCSLSSVTMRGVPGGLLILHVHSLCRLSSISNTSITIPVCSCILHIQHRHVCT